MNDREQRTDRVFYGVWVVAACFVLLFLFAGAGFYSFSIFIEPLEAEFGWKRSAISLAMSLYMVVHGLVGPFVGHAVQRYGPRRVMTLSALLSGAAFILVSFTDSLWFFYASYIVLSIGNSGIGFIPVSAVLARWFVRRRGTAIAVSMVGISAGGLVLAPLAGTVIAQFGWRACFVALGVLVWVLALPVTLFVIKGSPQEMGLLPDGDAGAEEAAGGDTDAREGLPATAAEQGWTAREALGDGQFYRVAAAFFLAPVAQMALLQHQVPLIIEAGISPSTAAAALGLTAGLGALGKLGFGRISEIVPFRYAATLCFGLQAVAALVLLFSQSMAAVWAYVALFGFAMGGVVVLLPLVVAHFFGLTSFAVIMGVLSLVQATGNATGALLSGLIYDTFGSYDYAMMACVVLYTMACVAILGAGEPRPHRRT